MSDIFLGLGSNVSPAQHLTQGLADLRELLGPLRCSPVYEGAAVGFDGAPFWNLVVQAHTDQPVGVLHHEVPAARLACHRVCPGATPQRHTLQ